ncbi:MAG: universal stress protein [Bacteroidota bacterium]
MKKILVPVDFSDHTHITCAYALEMARLSGGEIKLFHTYFDQIIIADTSFPDTLNMTSMYNEELMKDIYKQALQSMKELEESVGEMMLKSEIQNVTLTTKVVGGDVEHELKELCSDYHPDLVVMGTTGKGNTLQVWGKVSTYIMDHAKAPVITVPAIKNFLGFKNIMFAADLTDGNETTLTHLISLFSPLESVIHVVHFIAKVKPTDVYMKMKGLQLKFGEEELQQKIRFNVIEIEEENQKAIDHFVAERKIDLIAFQPHRRSLLSMIFTKKITRKNLFETNIPMVAMPSDKV